MSEHFFTQKQQKQLTKQKAFAACLCVFVCLFVCASYLCIAIQVIPILLLLLPISPCVSGWWLRQPASALRCSSLLLPLCLSLSLFILFLPHSVSFFLFHLYRVGKRACISIYPTGGVLRGCSVVRCR